MKTDFQFANLLGTVYCKGDLVFNPEGTCLLSPVGNRITVFDLVRNESFTLPYAHRKNISRIALTPRGNLLLSIDEDGRAILANFPRRLPLHYFSFKGPVTALAFSPSGGYFVVGLSKRSIEVWKTPSTPDDQGNGGDDDETAGDLEFAPFVRHHSHTRHHDIVQSIEWSSDSRFFLSASKDLTARIWSLNREEGFVPTTLAGHREGVLAAWFSKDQETIFTVSQDGALFKWNYVPKSAINGDDSGIELDEVDESTARWRITNRHYFQQTNAKTTCASFHPPSGLLVAGFSNGLFGLYELPDFNNLHTLSISQNGINAISINQSGEWLAFGASKLGQLLVWEWQSESYILKQQGHFDSVNSTTYSSDSQHMITAADDGKIKVWDVQSGFCSVTFTEHSAAVTACEFAKRGRVLFSSSLDGSVRAWDLVRYRNFRTFTAPTRISFSSLAVDPSGEVVCAGSVDDFDVFVWSVQTGQLLDQLAGHEGPVAALAFAQSGGTLVTGSWDHTVRIWNIFGRTQTSEPLNLQADVLAVAVRPDARQIAVATLDGELSFWSLSDAVQETGIDSRRDVSGGRRLSDRRTAAAAVGTKSFSSITYSVDGSCLLAGGNSKYLCLYAVETGTLVKKFAVSVNLSLDGTQEFLNSKDLTEAGPIGLFDTQGEAEDLEDRIDNTLPGAQRGDAAARRFRPQVRVTGVAFAPSGRSFCASATDGLLVYSLDSSGPAANFDPFDLDVSITPASIAATLRGDINGSGPGEPNYLRALVMAFRLNEAPLLRAVFEAIPSADVSLIARALPRVYVPRLLRFLASAIEQTPHLEYCLVWLEAVLSQHGDWIRRDAAAAGFAAELRAVQRAVSKIAGEVARVAEGNMYSIDYLLAKEGTRKNLPQEDEETGSLLAIEDTTKIDGAEARATGLKSNGTNGINGHREYEDESSNGDDEWMGLE